MESPQEGRYDSTIHHPYIIFNPPLHISVFIPINNYSTSITHNTTLSSQHSSQCSSHSMILTIFGHQSVSMAKFKTDIQTIPHYRREDSVVCMQLKHACSTHFCTSLYIGANPHPSPDLDSKLGRSALSKSLIKLALFPGPSQRPSLAAILEVMESWAGAGNEAIIKYYED